MYQRPSGKEGAIVYNIHHPFSVGLQIMIMAIIILSMYCLSPIAGQTHADVIKRDPLPPDIVSVSTSVFADSDGTYELGSTVRITVTDGSGNPEFTGTVSIVSIMDPWQVTDALTSQGGGLYYYMWNTLDRIPGDYYIETTLEDDFGNIDDDGLTPYPDVTVKLQDTTPPRIVEVRSMVEIEGKKDYNGTYPEDSEVLIIVHDVNQEAGLTGTITIVDDKEATLVDEEALTPETDGTYTYLWYTDDLPPGKYYVETTLKDTVGNKDADGLSNHPDLVITIQDVTPPDVFRVDSSVDLDEDEKYFIGSQVYLEVIEDNYESGLDGQIYIYSRRSDDIELWDYLEDQGDGTYIYIWDTQDFQPGKYEIEVTLEDSHGNRDDDGADEDIDLLITLEYETTPPAVASVWPQFNAVDVSREVVIFVEFKEPLDVTDLYPGYFVLKDESGETINGLLRYNSEGNQTRFTPLERLKGNHTYTMTLTTDIHDLVGNPLKNPIIWSFTTEPTPTPSIISAFPKDTTLVLNESEYLTFTIDHILVPGEKIGVSWYVNDKVSQGTGETIFRFDPKKGVPGTNVVVVEVTAGEAVSNRSWQVIIVELQPETGGSGSIRDDGMANNLIFWLCTILLGVLALIVFTELLIARKRYRVPPTESGQSVDPLIRSQETQPTVRSAYSGRMPEAIAASQVSYVQGAMPPQLITPSPQTAPSKLLPPYRRSTRPVESTTPHGEYEYIACYNCGNDIPIPAGKRSGTVKCPSCGTEGAL